jgi:hypothetical protein
MGNDHYTINLVSLTRCEVGIGLILLHNVGTLLIAGLLFLLPGLTLLLWLWPDLDEDWFGWLALSAGLSVALFPFVLLWTRTLGGIHLGAPALWGILLICALLIAWRLVRRPALLQAVHRAPRGFSFLMLLLALAVVGLRLWTIRGLTIPLWADSYQHTMIAQLIVDNGGLFDSWLPYASLKSFTYHYGFHTAVAFFHWLTGVEMPRSVLMVGQLLNALAAFAIYPLAVRLTGNRWVGLVAVLTAAVLSPMPGFYVNWGRYTQLAGQVILPVALWLTWEMLVHPSLSWQRLSLAAVAVAGLALTHYRVILFYVAILGAWWLIFFVFSKDRRQYGLASLGRLALMGGLALLAISPWLMHLISSRLVRQQASLAARGQQNDFIRNEYNRFLDIRDFMPTPMLGAIGVGLVFSLVRKRTLAFFILLWVGFLFLLANPYLLKLPGTGVVNNFAVYISLYIPAAIMIGYGAVSVAQYGQRYWRGLPWAFGLLVLGGSLWTARIQANMVQAENFMLVTPTDERAMAWIRTNTPPDARFLINGYFGYGGSSLLGADAGWWIPLLAGRENTIPPLTYVSETPISPGYPRQVHALMAQVQATDLSTPEGLDLLVHNGVTHIYIGQREGRVGNPGASLISAETLLAAPYYEPVYHEDRVWIFEVLTELSDEGG